MSCPYCGSENLKKNGIKHNKQQYQCKDCKKYFSSNNVEIKPKEETVKCIYCGGHTNKSGKTKWGVQIYWCRDCHKRFNENTMPQPPIEERCPYCGGELKYKGWSNNGHNRRYICKECGKGFSGDLSNLQVRVIEKPCPYCGSEDVKKGGRLRSGAKRYFCNSCGKGYSENTIVTDPPHKPDKCPECGGTHINCSGHDKNGKQRYKCMSCGRKFVENPTQNKFKVWQHTCPKCGHTEARKAGKSQNKQYYQCLNCGHKDLEGGKYKHISAKDVVKLRKYYRQGLPIKHIAKNLNRSEKITRTIIKKFMTPMDKMFNIIGQQNNIRNLALSGYSTFKLCGMYGKTMDELNSILEKEYKFESITEEQKNLIIKFGVGASVPVDYIAPYIPCSTHMCDSILSQYKITKRKYKRTEVEKNQDYYELDKFLGR